MSSIFFIFISVLQLAFAQKCSYTFDDKNIFKTVRCVNVMSMMDIAEETRANWTSIEIVNKASHAQFSNNAVNVPYLNVIQTLDLSRVGKLTLTDAGFRDYESLKSLDICKTETTALKSSWFSRKNIEVLNVSENLIKGLKKDDMKFFSRLRIFNASFNEIKTLEANTFLESKKLEVISLSNNELINVAFDNLENLKQLFLRDNSIVTIWAVTFYRMPRLETLHLAENDITGIVDRSFSTLESLKYLNLSNNKIPHLGPWLFAGGSKTKLEELDFSFNSITIVYPICLHELPLLTFLDMSNNKITEIFEKNFQKSTALLTLYLCHNRINKIAPKSFEKLLMMKTLDVSSNKLDVFKPEMFGGNLFAGNKLKKLNLSNNLLSVLNGNLFAIFVNLGSLYLSGNKIKLLPVDLLKFNVNLQKLSVTNNQIESFPAGFFDSLVSLQELAIEDNRIAFLLPFTGPKKLLKLTIGQNPWQCNCLRETIIWARKNKIQIDDFNFNSPFPSCVSIAEALCIKDVKQLESYQIYDKYTDGVALVESDIGRKRFDL